MMKWHDGGLVAVYDGTNSTLNRRKWVRASIQEQAKGMKYNIVWIESISDDEDTIEASIRDVKLRSPDYVDMDKMKL